MNSNHPSDHQALIDEIKSLIDLSDWNAAFSKMDELDWGNQRSDYIQLKNEYIHPVMGYNEQSLKQRFKVFLSQYGNIALPTPPQLNYDHVIYKVAFFSKNNQTPIALRVGFLITPNRMLTYLEADTLDDRLDDEVIITYAGNEKTTGKIYKIEKSFVLIEVDDDLFAHTILPCKENDGLRINQISKIYCLPTNSKEPGRLLQIECVDVHEHTWEYRTLKGTNRKTTPMIGTPLIEEGTNNIIGLVCRIDKNKIFVKANWTIFRASTLVRLLISNASQEDSNREKALKSYLKDILIIRKEKEYKAQIDRMLDQLLSVSQEYKTAPEPAKTKLRIEIEGSMCEFGFFVKCLAEVMKKKYPNLNSFLKSHNHFLESFVTWIDTKGKTLNCLQSFTHLLFLYFTLYHLKDQSQAKELSEVFMSMRDGVNAMLGNIRRRTTGKDDETVTLYDKLDEQKAFVTIQQLRKFDTNNGIGFNPILFAFIFVIGNCRLEKLEGADQGWLDECLIRLGIDRNGDVETQLKQRFDLESLYQQYQQYCEDGQIENWFYSGDFFFKVLSIFLKTNEIDDEDMVPSAHKMVHLRA